jgi:hypothetical protein
MEVMRQTALDVALHQEWARPENRARYIAADALRWCDRWFDRAVAAHEWALVERILWLRDDAEMLWAACERA